MSDEVNAKVETPQINTSVVDSETSAINPFDITFESKESCQRFIDRCMIRWEWTLRLVKYKAKVENPDSDSLNSFIEVERYRPQAHKLGGVVHDTQCPTYRVSGEDTPLDPYVMIQKHGIHKFTIVNKYGA